MTIKGAHYKFCCIDSTSLWCDFVRSSNVSCILQTTLNQMPFFSNLCVNLNVCLCVRVCALGSNTVAVSVTVHTPNHKSVRGFEVELNLCVTFTNMAKGTNKQVCVKKNQMATFQTHVHRGRVANSIYSLGSATAARVGVRTPAPAVCQ